MTLLAVDVERVQKALPSDVRNLLVTEAGLYLGGGFIRDVISGAAPSDIDIFCSDAIVAESLAVNMAAERIGRTHVTEYAITVIAPGCENVQFIHGWSVSSGQDCIDRFDFTVCRAAIWFVPVDIQGPWLSVCDELFYPDLAAKRLRYTQPDRKEKPGSSLLRVLKFVRRGWSIDHESLAGVLARFFRDYSSFNENEMQANFAEELEQTELNYL